MKPLHPNNPIGFITQWGQVAGSAFWDLLELMEILKCQILMNDFQWAA